MEFFPSRKSIQNLYIKSATLDKKKKWGLLRQSVGVLKKMIDGLLHSCHPPLVIWLIFLVFSERWIGDFFFFNSGQRCGMTLRGMAGSSAYRPSPRLWSVCLYQLAAVISLCQLHCTELYIHLGTEGLWSHWHVQPLCLGVFKLNCLKPWKHL